MGRSANAYGFGGTQSVGMSCQIFSGLDRVGRTLEHGLTPAEARVLELIAAGWNNDRIAQCLNMMPKTVRNHVTHMFSKLGVQDRAAAIILAREHGLGPSASRR